MTGLEEVERLVVVAGRAGTAGRAIDGARTEIVGARTETVAGNASREVSISVAPAHWITRAAVSRVDHPFLILLSLEGTALAVLDDGSVVGDDAAHAAKSRQLPA
ncbi:hypothetical protein Y590_25470 (plasmid) [Methylobacterium sp. AMS5]|nr:hypothetical protein Y590_25470 [Methylobacterium sp. AMS5]